MAEASLEAVETEERSEVSKKDGGAEGRARRNVPDMDGSKAQAKRENLQMMD